MKYTAEQMKSFKQGYNRKRSMAKFFNDEFDLTLEEWIAAWDGKWELRGMRLGQYRLQRTDCKGPWNADNVKVISATEAGQRAALKLNQKQSGIDKRIHKDDRKHKMYRCWVQQRNQALFRKEGWDFEFEDWCELWDENWEQKGRGTKEYCMTRVDPTKGWSEPNCVVAQRKAVLRHNAGLRAQAKND